MQTTRSALALAVAFGLATGGAAAAQTASPMRPETGGGTPTGAAMGEKMLTGTVAAVDAGTGRLALDVGGRRVDLQFTPDAVAGLAPGERVTVMFGIRPERGATAVPGGAETR